MSGPKSYDERNRYGNRIIRNFRLLSAVHTIRSDISYSFKRYEACLVKIMRLRRDMLDADEGKRQWYVRAYGLSIQELNELAIACLRKMKQAKESGPRDYEAKGAAIKQHWKDRDHRDLHTKNMRRVAKFNKKV